MLPLIALGAGGSALVKAAEVEGIDPAALLSVTTDDPATFVIAVIEFVPWPFIIELPVPVMLQA